MSKCSLTFVISQQGQFIRKETFTRPLIRIGRDARNHLQLSDGSVAERQALIEVTAPGSILLCDLGAQSRTLLNGAWIEEACLRQGDRITLGQHELLLERVTFEADATEDGESEVRHALAAEVTVAWGENVLHVAHLSASERFVVGDDPASPSDFLVPREKLGTSRLPLVLGGPRAGSGIVIAIPPQARGFIEGSEGVRMSLEQARAYGQPCAELPAGCQLTLALGTRAQLEFGDIILRVAVVLPGKPMPHGLGGIDASALAYLGLSALSVGGLLSSFAFLTPKLAGLTGDEIDPDRLYLLQQYLAATAEREQKPEPGSAEASNSASPSSGARARDDEGALGRTDTPPEKRGRLALRGQAAPAQRELAREDALREATTEYMIGLLATANGGDPDAPSAPWGASIPAGSDPESARGDLWSDAIGGAFGVHGLAPSGPGRGGGGRSEGIGIGKIGTIGSEGDGERDMLLSHGRQTRAHRTETPRLRPGQVHVGGRLPPQTVQRIVRQNHSRFRHCYEQGLLQNPSLAGRVGVRFVIGRDGAVSAVSNAGSDLPDPRVVSCVSRAFYDLSFPKPEGGVVTVVYPLVFSAD